MAIVLSVVVPMFNEEAVLPLFVQRLRPALDKIDTAYEVVAVDDGSSDLTAATLQRLKRDWPQLRGTLRIDSRDHLRTQQFRTCHPYPGAGPFFGN